MLPSQNMNYCKKGSRSAKLCKSAFINFRKMLIHVFKTCRGPSENYHALKIYYLGYTLEQCEDLKYPKAVAYEDERIHLLQSQRIVTDMETVLGCWLFIGQWHPDTSGKGKWYSPWVANNAPH